jgi:hypothetical protein
MLEPWEKLLLITLFASLNLLLLAAIVMYFPAHLSSMRTRGAYYLWGSNSPVHGRGDHEPIFFDAVMTLGPFG